MLKTEADGLDYFQIARAKSTIRNVNDKYALLSPEYKTAGTNPGRNPKPTTDPNEAPDYPPFYQNAVIPALNWAISNQPSEYRYIRLHLQPG